MLKKLDINLVVKIITISLVVALIYFWQVNISIFEFNREQILHGEIWRIITGHFVHLNFEHFFFNAASLIVVSIIFRSKINITSLLLLSVFFSILISFLVLLLYPNIDWFNGFSGVLHAIFSCLCIQSLTEDRMFKIMMAILLSKVTMENINFFKLSEFALVELHLLGVIVGSLLAVYQLRIKNINNK